MTRESDKPTNAEAAPKDVLLVAGKTEDGEGLRGLRWQQERPDGVSITELRPVSDGQPVVHGELVALSPRTESPFLWDVDVACRVEQGKVVEKEGGHSGPAQVSTHSYRLGWEQVFGRPSGRKIDKTELN